MYTLDTNAIIYFLKAEPHAGPFVRDLLDGSETLYVSTVTEIELFGFSKLEIAERLAIVQIIDRLIPVPLDSYLARMAGDVKRLYGLKTPDSAIAATALFTGSTLVTRNVDDFKRVEGLSLRRV